MKIIYGSSSQKSIERHQRITHRERRRKREAGRTLTEQSAKPSDDTAIKTNTNQTASGEDALLNNRKSIPHEISLIHTELPAVSADSQMTEKNRKGVLEHEPDFQPAESALPSPQTQTQASAAATATVGMSSESAAPTASAPSVAAHESAAANADNCQQSDDGSSVSGFHGRSRGVKEPVLSSQMNETTLPTDSAADSSFSSTSPEGQILLGRLNQLLKNEVNLYEILLPAGVCQQNPVIIFLHEEALPEC